MEIIYGFVKLTLQMYVAIDIWRFRQQSHHQDSPDIVVSAPSPVQTYSTSPPPPYGSMFTYHLTHLHPPPYSVVKVWKLVCRYLSWILYNVQLKPIKVMMTHLVSRNKIIFYWYFDCMTSMIERWNIHPGNCIQTNQYKLCFMFLQ